MTQYLNPSTRSNGADQIVVPEAPSTPEVEEAPYDNTQYARVNGDWAPVAASVPGFSVEGEGDPPTGFVIYGTEFRDWLDPLPKGHVALSYRTDPSTYSASEQPYIQLDATLTAGRLYRFNGRGAVANDTSGVRCITVLRSTLDGTPAQLTSPARQYWRCAAANAGQSSHFSVDHYYAGGVIGGPDIELSLLLCVYPDGSGQARFAGAAAEPIYLSIEDLGIYKGDTGIDRDPVTAPTPPPTLKTYTKTYTSTTAKCFMGSGAADSSQGEQDMKQGYSSYDGDSESLWIFPPFTGAVGAVSISKVRLYLYANHWNYNSGGTALIKRHNYGSTGAIPGGGPSQSSVTSSSGWPKPGGRWVTLPSSVYAGIIGNTIKGFGVGPSGGTNQLYYGRFNKSGAKVEITYKR